MPPYNGIIVFLSLLTVIETATLPSQQLQSLRLSVIQDHFQYARKELLLSLILHQAQPTHLWKPCTSTPTTTTELQTSCYTQPQTAGHLFLFFSFDNRSSIRIPEIPTKYHPTILSIHTPSKTIASNVPARDFFYRSNNQRGAFTIPTRCDITTENHLVITVSFLGYTFRYAQLCPRGTVNGLHISTSHPLSPPWHAGANDASTAVDLVVKPPLENLHVRSMRVLSDRHGITAILDDDEGDFMSLHKPWKTRIVYECDVYGPSAATITLLLDVKPYDMVNKTWRKSCGADHPPEGLVVSTAPWGGDIAFNGRVLSRGRGGGIGRMTKLFVGWFDTEKGSDLWFGDVHVSSSSVVSADVTTPGKVVRAGREVEWVVSVRCVWIGGTDVRILVRFRGGYLLDIYFWTSCGVFDVLMEWGRWGLLVGLVVTLLQLGRGLVRDGRVLWLARRWIVGRGKRL